MRKHKICLNDHIAFGLDHRFSVFIVWFFASIEREHFIDLPKKKEEIYKMKLLILQISE